MNTSINLDNENSYLLLKKWPHYLFLPLMLFYINQKYLAVVIFFMFLYFFRSPTRLVKNQNFGDLMSPADGIIMRIMDLPDKQRVVSIYLSITNVHVQYSPCNGIIKSQSYKKGKFNLAYILEKSDFNEKLTTNILSEANLSVSVVQIAGQVAQRIESFVKINDVVKIGQKIGVIKFGSRVDVYFPSFMKLDCKLGDVVKAGKSKIAFL